MDILRTFKLVDSEHIVNIQGTFEKPLFQANQIGKILEIKNIHDSLRDFDEEEKTLSIANTNGGYQQTLFLTENGLYRLINRSRKPVAVQFQKWISQVIIDIRINGYYKLKEENEIDKSLIKYKGDIEKHKMLIRFLDNKNIVYICKFRKEENKFLIKIGSSKNIKERMCHLTNAYDNIEAILLESVQITCNRRYETYLHNHDFIKKFYYPITNKEGKISKETYLVDEIQLAEFIKIMNNDKNRKEFNDDSNESSNIIEYKSEDLDKIIEIEKIKLKTEELKTNKINEIKELKKIELELNNIEKEKKNEEIVIDELDSEIESIYDSDEDDIDITTIYFSTKKMKPGIKSPLVYQYNINDLTTPFKIYDSPSEVERSEELKHLEISPTPLRNAAKNNTIYKGFRWYFVKRDETPPQSIPNTVQLKHKETEIKFLAMIDITQTKIMSVYQNQREATKARLMKCKSFHRAIQNGSISSGHYWKYFDDCSKEMQIEYLKNNVLPEKYVSKISKKVQQICPKTKQILKTYDSNRDVIKLFKMSVTSLKKYSESGEIHNGYIWKIC